LTKDVCPFPTGSLENEIRFIDRSVFSKVCMLYLD
jgi:hypothetical protein